jgi:hypothetical protein
VIELSCPVTGCPEKLEAYGHPTPDENGRVTVPFTKFTRASQRHMRAAHPTALRNVRFQEAPRIQNPPTDGWGEPPNPPK